MNALRRMLDRLLAGTCVVLFSVLVLVVVWQVITRQVLQSPAAWTDEVSRYLFVWVGLFATALVFSERGHLAVDIVARMLPTAGRRVLGALVQVAVIAFALLLLVYGGIRAAGGAWDQQLQSLPFTLGQMYIVLPITGVLIAFYAIGDLLSILSGAVDPFPEETDPAVEVHLDPDEQAATGAGATAAPRTTTDENRN
ncbi:C4-dicarboxylate ABC transporter permease [Mobilicoccus caccae]|uniref:C4-dicarboxylate ABC transporter permease n=2 Tax=Mobilicoccus caccae TaxID=1859295 RepID=A0ABQ6IJZ2_9MICO|nr:C4-dicarboxylate ABC transporter permease [Mobilicoccus caccae]